MAENPRPDQPSQPGQPPAAAADSAAPPVPELIPARMLNEFTYCPRLAYLMWVQQEWAESADTLDGKHAHRRVDREADSIARIHQRSVALASERLGLTAVIDLIEQSSGRARPVDYKRGKRPHVQRGAYDPERVQLCVQGLILEEHGYVCEEGILYFAESRERVRAALTAIGLALPPKRIIVNLSPADLPKEGSHDDLQIALCLLAAIGAVEAESLSHYVAVGELSLDGRIAASPGVLLAALHASGQGMGLSA